MHKNTDLSGDFLFFFLLSPFQKGAQTQHKRKSRDPKKMIMLSPNCTVAVKQAMLRIRQCFVPTESQTIIFVVTGTLLSFFFKTIVLISQTCYISADSVVSISSIIAGTQVDNLLPIEQSQYVKKYTTVDDKRPEFFIWYSEFVFMFFVFYTFFTVKIFKYSNLLCIQIYSIIEL